MFQEYLPTVLSILISGVSAFWVFYTTKVIPAQQERRRFLESASQTKEADQREHLQRTQSDALQQVLQLNTDMAKYLMEMSNGRMAKLVEAQGQLVGLLTKMEANTQVVTREWSRIEEVLADIDLELREIKGALLVGRDGDVTEAIIKSTVKHAMREGMDN